MKKTLTTLLLLASTTTVFSETFFAPEWNDFAPSNFKNINPEGFHWTASGRYWAERKTKFDNRINQCNSLDGNAKTACYKELRDIEVNANKMYYKRSTSNALNNLIFSSF